MNLNPGYLQTLSAGDHTLTAMFDDGDDVTTGFTILAAAQENTPTPTPTPVPTNTAVTSTGESFPVTVVFGIVMIVASAALFGAGIKTPKHKIKKSKTPNRPDQYKDQDRFKDTHHKQNRRYYDRLAVNKENSGQRWTVQEIEMVLAHEEPDRVLSEKLGRTVKAIQTIRGTYKDRKIEE